MVKDLDQADTSGEVDDLSLEKWLSDQFNARGRGCGAKRRDRKHLPISGLKTNRYNGTGQTYDEAVKDAVDTIPKTYQRDPANGQVIECTVSEDMLRITNGERCDTWIAGNQYRITIPVIAR